MKELSKQNRFIAENHIFIFRIYTVVQVFLTLYICNILFTRSQTTETGTPLKNRNTVCQVSDNF